MKKLVLWLVILSALMFVFVAPVAAQGSTPPVDSPQSFLRWLTLAGPAVAGALVSLLERKWPWFQKLSSIGKFWMNLLFTVVLSGGAGILLLYIPDSTWAAIQPIFAIIAGAVLSALGYVANQFTYLFAVKPYKMAEIEAREWQVDFQNWDGSDKS